MSSGNFFITNPKDNNVDLEVTFNSADGSMKKLITIRPGETCKIEKKAVRVRELSRPARLELDKEGSFVKDTRGPVGTLKRVIPRPSDRP